jgi:tetratricopeptide (TPR) repeat protein
MSVHELLLAHKYTEAIRECKKTLGKNPNDMVALGGMARALRGKSEYEESLLFFEQLAERNREDKVANTLAPGSFPWAIDIACLHWILGRRPKAIRLMHDLAAGVLDGTVKYGDAAGGMSQGLLLYYMSVSAKSLEEAYFALDYMTDRVKRNTNRAWPFAVARYYLGSASFEDVMDAVNRHALPPLTKPPAKVELGKRHRLVVALFHDGVKSRARGDEEHCLLRMSECYDLENPRLEQEWYLARHEVEDSGKRRS